MQDVVFMFQAVPCVFEVADPFLLLLPTLGRGDPVSFEELVTPIGTLRPRIIIVFFIFLLEGWLLGNTPSTRWLGDRLDCCCLALCLGTSTATPRFGIRVQRVDRRDRRFARGTC
jgi:hypothetical protein